MDLPKISVIIPLYNAEKYIGDCLESLLVQTFQDFEVIVVDDCSTDNSVAIVQSYAEKFGGRLKIARTKKKFGRRRLCSAKFGTQSFTRRIYFFSWTPMTLSLKLRWKYFIGVFL